MSSAEARLQQILKSTNIPKHLAPMLSNASMDVKITIDNGEGKGDKEVLRELQRKQIQFPGNDSAAKTQRDTHLRGFPTKTT